LEYSSPPTNSTALVDVKMVTKRVTTLRAASDNGVLMAVSFELMPRISAHGLKVPALTYFDIHLDPCGPFSMTTWAKIYGSMYIP
jgi:hypothetical protein